MHNDVTDVMHPRNCGDFSQLQNGGKPCKK